MLIPDTDVLSFLRRLSLGFRDSVTWAAPFVFVDLRPDPRGPSRSPALAWLLEPLYLGLGAPRPLPLPRLVLSESACAESLLGTAWSHE